MGIQGSINQLLSMATVGARMSHRYEQQSAIRQAERNVKTAEKQEKALEGRATGEGAKADALLREAAESKAEATKTLFKVKPTRETLSKALLTSSGASTLPKGPSYEDAPLAVWRADPEEIRQEQAEFEAEAALNREQQRIARSVELGKQRFGITDQVEVPRKKVDLTGGLQDDNK